MTYHLSLQSQNSPFKDGRKDAPSNAHPGTSCPGTSYPDITGRGASGPFIAAVGASNLGISIPGSTGGNDTEAAVDYSRILHQQQVKGLPSPVTIETAVPAMRTHVDLLKSGTSATQVL